jgi:hypothetical protein
MPECGPVLAIIGACDSNRAGGAHLAGDIG